MDEIIEKIEYLIQKHPEKVVEFTKHMYRHNPEAVEKMLSTMKEHGHITKQTKYDELVSKLKWANKQNKGERWKLDEIKRVSQIDFKNVDFTEFDYAYLVNMLYAKCCKYFSEMSFYLKLAKGLLEDDDEETKLYKGAYSEKHHNKQRGAQMYRYEYEDYERDYDEENRRRRMRSDDDYDYDDYDEENRRGVRRYRNDTENRRPYYDDRYENRYYKESNMGFTTK